MEKVFITELSGIGKPAKLFALFEKNEYSSVQLVEGFGSDSRVLFTRQCDFENDFVDCVVWVRNQVQKYYGGSMTRDLDIIIDVLRFSKKWF